MLLHKPSIIETIKGIKETTGIVIKCDSVTTIDIILPAIDHIYISDYISGLLMVNLELVFRSSNYVCLKYPGSDIYIMLNVTTTFEILGTSIRSGYISVVSDKIEDNKLDSIISILSTRMSIYKNDTLITTGLLPYYSITPFGLQLSLSAATDINSIEANYADTVIESYNRIIEQGATGFTDVGKLVVMHGPPGTGKTMLSTAIATALYSYGYLLVKADGDNSLTSKYDELTSVYNKLIFLLDDSVNTIQKESASGKVLDIVSDANKNDALFICTFNQLRTSIHPAMVREGRLFDLIDIGLLDGDDITKAVHNIYGTDVTINDDIEKLSLASIYAALCIDNQLSFNNSYDVTDLNCIPKLSTIKKLGQH